MSLNEDLQIYNAPDWAERRYREGTYYRWYNGLALQDESDKASKSDNTETVDLYPLRLNPIASTCRIHRNVLIGMINPNEYVAPPVRTVVDDTGKIDRSTLEKLEDFIETVWTDSRGAEQMLEAALLVQVTGGYAFKVSWEPWNTELSYRLRFIGIESPYFYPIYDRGDYWSLREAYIGYYISHESATNKYGINGKLLPPDDVLYLEHWTKTSYKITVGGIVPSITGYGTQDEAGKWTLSGDHNWGIVPIVYIPHYRDGSFFGPSHVPELEGLVKEKNARMADLGDAVKDSTHPVLVLSDVDRPPAMRPIQEDEQGNVLRWGLDIGMSRALANANKPTADYPTLPNVTPPLLDFSRMLDKEIRNQSDVASVATGDDDTASGRITGPVTAYRLWPTMAHCQAERVSFSTGLVTLARFALTIAMKNEASGQYKATGATPPGITEPMVRTRLNTTWPPQIPIERSERVTELNSRLSAGGISLQRYLEEIGETDVDGEIQRITEDKQRKVDMDAAVAQKEKPNDSKLRSPTAKS